MNARGHHSGDLFALAFRRWRGPGEGGLFLVVIASDQAEEFIIICAMESSNRVLQHRWTLLSGMFVESNGGIVVVGEHGAESDWRANAISGWPPMPSSAGSDMHRATGARTRAPGQ